MGLESDAEGGGSFGSMEECRKRVSRNQDGIQGEGSSKSSQKNECVWDPSRSDCCGERFFTQESGSGPEGMRRESEGS